MSPIGCHSLAIVCAPSLPLQLATYWQRSWSFGIAWLEQAEKGKYTDLQLVFTGLLSNLWIDSKKGSSIKGQRIFLLSPTISMLLLWNIPHWLFFPSCLWATILDRKLQATYIRYSHVLYYKNTCNNVGHFHRAGLICAFLYLPGTQLWLTSTSHTLNWYGFLLTLLTYFFLDATDDLLTRWAPYMAWQNYRWSLPDSLQQCRS